MTKRWLTKNQVVAWCEEWTDDDRAKVAAAIDAVGDQNLYTTPSSSYCAALTWGELLTPGDNFAHKEGWRRGLVIHRNKIEWLYGEATNELDPTLFVDLRETERTSFGMDYYVMWTPLSTYGGVRTRGKGASDEGDPRVCTACFMELPVHGTCPCAE